MTTYRKILAALNIVLALGIFLLLAETLSQPTAGFTCTANSSSVGVAFIATCSLAIVIMDIIELFRGPSL